MSEIDFRKKLDMFFDKNDNYIFDFDIAEYSQEYIIENKYKLPKLFRYSPADYYNIRTLEMNKLYLSEIGKMNDIFEGLTGKITNDVIENLDKLYDLVYIKSFSENCDNLRMWSTYADNYSGMCVEYDARKLSDKVLYHLFPVRYSDKRVTNNNLGLSFSELTEIKNSIDEIDVCFLKDVVGLFISKSKDWEYEKEWRIIVSYLQMNRKYDEVEMADDSELEKELYNIDSQVIEFDCVSRIYLGPKMEEIKKNHIREIGMRLGVDVIEMSLSKTEYKLVPKNEI